jgi:hypothetical protein
MKKLFFKLKAALLFADVHPYIELPPKWTAEDAKNLSHFLTSYTGRKWSLWMWHTVQSAALRSTYERVHAAYECGYASGCRGIMAQNDALLKISADESATHPNEPADGVLADLEQFTP